MLPFPAPILPAYSPASSVYVGLYVASVPVPAGATTVTIKALGPGGRASPPPSGSGAGGAFSQRTNLSLSGITALHLSIPEQVPSATIVEDHYGSRVRANSSAGTVLCYAEGAQYQSSGFYAGGRASEGVGDILRSGGDGVFGPAATTVYRGGGGAGNTYSDGADGAEGTQLNTSLGGAPGTGLAPAGKGGVASVGGNYGAGGGYANGVSYDGAPGWVELTFT